MLAYSSINHAGFILLGVWAGSARGSAATLFYLMTYAPTVVATFAIVTLMGGLGDEHHSIERYRGLARRQPWLGAASRCSCSASSARRSRPASTRSTRCSPRRVDAGGGALALLALLSAAIAAFFYLRWTMALYAEDDRRGDARGRAARDRRS